MKKYKYRIIQEKAYSNRFTIEKSEINRWFGDEWRFVAFSETIEECDSIILDQIKRDPLPDIQIIKEVNPHK